MTQRSFAGAARRSKHQRLASRLEEAGFTNLFINRGDYKEYRGIETLMGYLATARRSVLVVGYWMAQGREIEDLKDLGAMVLHRPDFQIRIAIIDPVGPHIDSLAEHLGESPERVTQNCKATLDKLIQVRRKLPGEAQQRMIVKTYTSTAVASIIVLDEGEPDARAQIDIKLYRTVRRNSVGFETTGTGKDLYESLHRAASLRFEDAQEWQPAARSLPE
ncbi:hypothetical protein [Paractinoplanes globisporus]|uniref:TIR domain-containing protein n=1 Tax=Paractinoplanes globisporus TaxID=113565 RepID=A0ABW6W705_9ACTN|nr:hypothetical protein [Actinoplanes globisporus]